MLTSYLSSLIIKGGVAPVFDDPKAFGLALEADVDAVHLGVHGQAALQSRLDLFSGIGSSPACISENLCIITLTRTNFPNFPDA